MAKQPNSDSTLPFVVSKMLKQLLPCVAAGGQEGIPSQSSRSIQASLAAAEGQIEALNQRVNRKNAQLAEAHTALLAARQDMQLHSQSSARSAGGSSENGELDLLCFNAW